MSAVAPASRPSSSTGMLAAVCMRAMSSGEVVSTVISQVPAVSCIQVPTEETVEASQRSRKSGMRSGAKAPEVSAGVAANGGSPTVLVEAAATAASADGAMSVESV